MGRERDLLLLRQCYWQMTAKPATSQLLFTNFGTEYPPETEEDGTESAREKVAPKAGTILFLNLKRLKNFSRV